MVSNKAISTTPPEDYYPQHDIWAGHKWFITTNAELLSKAIAIK